MSTHESQSVVSPASESGIGGAIRSIVARELRTDPASLSVSRLAGDASTRSFFRARYPGGSVIAVEYPLSFNIDETSGRRLERWCAERPADGRVTFANDPICHVELTALFAERGVPVPAIVAVVDRESVILVEDVGDDLLQGWLQTAPPADKERAYERAVDLIATIRGATETVTAAGIVASRLEFDDAKLGWELEFFRANWFGRYLDVRLDPDVAEGVEADCRDLARTLAARPRVLCHRDYHARNLMLRSGTPVPEGVVVIDFQDARLGPVTYDLVSLLADPYVPLDEHFRARMRARFCERLREEGAWPGVEAFDEEYDLMTVQRLLKAVGTYAYQAAVCDKRVYVPYINPALGEAKAALARLDRFEWLRGSLEETG